MWENIGSSGGVIIGAIALFVAFTLLLFLYERRDGKKKRKPVHKKRTPYVVPSGRRNDRAA